MYALTSSKSMRRGVPSFWCTSTMWMCTRRRACVCLTVPCVCLTVLYLYTHTILPTENDVRSRNVGTDLVGVNVARGALHEDIDDIPQHVDCGCQH